MKQVIMGAELVGEAPKHDKIIMINDGATYIFTTEEVAKQFPNIDWEKYEDEFIDELISESPGFYEDLKKLFV